MQPHRHGRKPSVRHGTQSLVNSARARTDLSRSRYGLGFPGDIYSVEVESVLSDHPDVDRVATIGVPSDKWGEEVKAIVVPRPGATPDAAAIIAFARERMAAYKAPKSVDFVDALPVTSVGKIAKNLLRERYWQGKDRRIN